MNVPWCQLPKQKLTRRAGSKVRLYPRSEYRVVAKLDSGYREKPDQERWGIQDDLQGRASSRFDRTSFWRIRDRGNRGSARRRSAKPSSATGRSECFLVSIPPLMFRLFPPESLVQTADETFVRKRIRLSDCQTSTYEMLSARRSDTVDVLWLYLKTQAISLPFDCRTPSLRCSSLSLLLSSSSGQSLNCCGGEDVNLSYHQGHRRSRSSATSWTSQPSIHGSSLSA